MPRVRGREVFGIDWTNLEHVKQLADRLGEGNIVIKYPAYPNYNITHAEREDHVLENGGVIIYRS